MKGLGMRKAMGYNMSSITNSPVNGLLYVRGKISAQPNAHGCGGHRAASCPCFNDRRSCSSIRTCPHVFSHTHTVCTSPGVVSCVLCMRQAAVRRRRRAMCPCVCLTARSARRG